MNESNWVIQLKESYLKEIASPGNANMSAYMNGLRTKLVSHVPNSEKHVDSFIDQHILPQMSLLHTARIDGARTSDEIDMYSSHTADNHKHKFFSYVIGQSGDEPNDEPEVDHEAYEPGQMSPDDEEPPRD